MELKVNLLASFSPSSVNLIILDGIESDIVNSFYLAVDNIRIILDGIER